MRKRIRLSERLWLCGALALGLFVTACTSHRVPSWVGETPLDQRSALLASLDSLRTGEDILLVRHDGLSVRGYYEANNDDVIFVRMIWSGWRTLFKLGLKTGLQEFPLTDIEYVSKVELTTTGYIVSGAGIALTVAAVWATFCCRENDDAE